MYPSSLTISRSMFTHMAVKILTKIHVGTRRNRTTIHSIVTSVILYVSFRMLLTLMATVGHIPDPVSTHVTPRSSDILQNHPRTHQHSATRRHVIMSLGIVLVLNAGFILQAGYQNAVAQRPSNLSKVEAVSNMYFRTRVLLNSIHKCRWRPYSWRILRKVRTVLFLSFSCWCIISIRFHNQAASLNVSATDLYSALLRDAEDQPPNWDLQGRQANIWKMLSTCLIVWFLHRCW